MKFTDGFWQLRPGVAALYSADAHNVEKRGEELVVTAPTRVIKTRADTLNCPTLRVTVGSPLANVVSVTIEHWAGAREGTGFAIARSSEVNPEITIGEDGGRLTSGELSAIVSAGAPWDLRFMAGGRELTSSGPKSIGYIQVDEHAVNSSPVFVSARGDRGQEAPAQRNFLHQQLALGVGELVYGLGERFGPVVKNGQSVDIWNADGGTSSEQAYKNVPFYLTNRGYGVLVNSSEHVSLEIGSETVERVQFSVAGERLEYFVIYGPTPKEILARYTELTGRPARVPAWSYGLWLSTSFTTAYDEVTVSGFIDEMSSRDIPLSVFHFDCFWMREFNWCDFEWDPAVFPDPEGMLARLHKKDLHVCVWINPYIGQRSPLFAEAASAGYLVRRPNGDVWQWDLWQAGMGLVDFTNPEATTWFQGKLRALLSQGVDAFKTDFGERIPLDVEYADGSDPLAMHNLYTQLYNRAVHDVLVEERGPDNAVVFARSATVGGQTMPVHWGGDSTSSFESMAETLRGGLSLAFSGFGFWSHDIGGFEGTPDPAVFKRWVAFGLLSSHSRLHGSDSYRVPWAFDDEAVEVTRKFTHLKLRLMPYLYAAGLEAHTRGTPMLRPMLLEFPDDPAVAHLDRQYMLGESLLVAPVFASDGSAEFYLPAGRWTNYFSGEQVLGPVWRREVHGFDTLPLYVREGTVLPLGGRDDRPDYDYLENLTIEVYPARDSGHTSITVTNPDGRSERFTVTTAAAKTTVAAEHSAAAFDARFAGRESTVTAHKGRVELPA